MCNFIAFADVSMPSQFIGDYVFDRSNYWEIGFGLLSVLVLILNNLIFRITANCISVKMWFLSHLHFIGDFVFGLSTD